MKKCTMQLEELVCPMCAQKIETALKNAPGVNSVSILFNSSKAKVQYDEQITKPEKLADAVRSIGYEVLKLS
jgi:copper chaperone CopZ